MQVTQANAAIVANLFTRLADERYVMRSVTAIKKGTEFTTQQVLDISAEIGCPLRRRAADDKLFIQRPVTVLEAQQIASKADAVLAGTQEAFDLDFTQPQSLPVSESEMLAESLSRAIEGGDEIDEDEAATRH